MAQDYQEQIEQQGIQEYRSYIQEQMSQAREAADAELRSQHLANALAANGMLLRGLDVGFVTGELNYKAIREVAQGLRSTRAFQSLMQDSGERLAKSGSVETLVRDLQDRDRELSEAQPSHTAGEVIRGVQAKVRAHRAAAGLRDAGCGAPPLKPAGQGHPARRGNHRVPECRVVARVKL